MSSPAPEYQLQSPTYWLILASDHHTRGEYDLERLCLEGAKSAAFREEWKRREEERLHSNNTNTQR